jgi:hypothetical protein
MIEDHLEQKVQTIFQAHGFPPEGQPQASIVDRLACRTVEEASLHEAFIPDGLPDACRIDIGSDPCAEADAQEAGETSVDGVGIQTLNALVSACGLSDQSAMEMLKKPVGYEEAKEAVNISGDDVGAKQQKATREPKPHRPPEKKTRVYVQNTIIHVEQGGRFSILNGYGVGYVLRLLLAFLLHNELLGHTLVFFVDGHSIYSLVVQFFSWYSKVSVILDWDHLRKKCRELLSMALKGSKIRHAVLGKLMPLLWYG